MKEVTKMRCYIKLGCRIKSGLLAFLFLFTTIFSLAIFAGFTVKALGVPAIFEIKWTSPEDGTYRTYDKNGVSQLTPFNNSPLLTNSGTAVQATVTFSLGGDTPAKPGEIQIRMPMYVFESRDGTPQGIIDMGVSDKMEGVTGFYYYLDTDANEIVIQNYMELDPAYVFKCDVVYHSTNGTTQYPSQIRDKYYYEFSAGLFVTLGDTAPVTANTNTLALQYNTDAKL